MNSDITERYSSNRKMVEDILKKMTAELEKKPSDKLTWGDVGDMYTAADYLISAAFALGVIDEDEAASYGFRV